MFNREKRQAELLEAAKLLAVVIGGERQLPEDREEMERTIYKALELVARNVMNKQGWDDPLAPSR